MSLPELEALPAAKWDVSAGRWRVEVGGRFLCDDEGAVRSFLRFVDAYDVANAVRRSRAVPESAVAAAA